MAHHSAGRARPFAFPDDVLVVIHSTVAQVRGADRIARATGSQRPRQEVVEIRPDARHLLGVENPERLDPVPTLAACGEPACHSCLLARTQTR